MDPCLLTFEVEGMIGWLEAIYRGDYSKSHFYTMDGMLEFHFRESFAYQDCIAVGWNGQYFEFSLTDADLKEAITSLQEQLLKFPPAGNRSDNNLA